MTDKEKLEKLKKLADAMYYAAQYLTADASRLHKTMEEYHQFIINEYHKEEPTIPDIVDEHFDEMLGEEPVSNPIDFEKGLYKAFGQVKDFTLGMQIAKWFYDMGKNSQEPVSELSEELAETYLAVFNKKFPILPILSGKQLADYKNFLNKCQQIFGLKEWGIRPIQSKLFEKLTLLWAAWGAEHLQGVGRQDEKEQDTPVSEDLEKVVEEIVDPTVLNAYGVKEIANRLRRTMIEPVSDSLEKAATKYAQDKYMPVQTSQAFKAGANWQEEQMMAKAIDGHATFEFYGLDSKTYGTIAHDPVCFEDLGLKDTDKVKVIVIKED